MNIQLLDAALKFGILPLVFKKHRGNWCALVPSKVSASGYPLELSGVRLLNWPRQSKMRLRFDAATRYGAQVHPDSELCWVNLRWAMKMPNWAGRFGALPEIAHAMKQAGLIGGAQ